MKQLSFVAVGILIGVFLAGRLGRSGRGAELLAALDTRARSFTGAVAAGYRSRDAELRTDG